MKYVVHRRFTAKALCGEVDFAEGTSCETKGSMITYNNKPVCVATSENAHQFFAKDDDGQGMLRGKLTQEIQGCLRIRDDDYQNRWDKIWDDGRCQKYKRVEHADFWLWNHDFFNAPIEDLEYILNLINTKETNA